MLFLQVEVDHAPEEFSFVRFESHGAHQLVQEFYVGRDCEVLVVLPFELCVLDLLFHSLPVLLTTHVLLVLSLQFYPYFVKDLVPRISVEILLNVREVS